MTDIDWSRAPEGATYGRYVEGKVPDFYKTEGEELLYWDDYSLNWKPCTWRTTSDDCMRPRPAEPAAWTGEGLPPVGTVCEFAGGAHAPEDAFDKDLKEGDQVTIIAHFKDGDLELAAFTFNPRLRNPDRGSACVEQGAHGCFRPIRTPEQIAAEEREKAMQEMVEHMRAARFDQASTEITPADMARAYAEFLYSAGYRKQEKAK